MRSNKRNILSLLFVCVVQLLISASICFYIPEATGTLLLLFAFFLSPYFYFCLLVCAIITIGLFAVSFIPIFLLRINYYLHWIIGGILFIISRIIFLFKTTPKPTGRGSFGFSLGNFTTEDLPYLFLTEVLFGVFILSIEILFCFISKRYWARKDGSVNLSKTD